MAWKYIIVQVGNREVPLIFPGDLVHRLMFENYVDYFVGVALELMPQALVTKEAVENLRKAIKPISAGEISFDVGTCSGGSETLGLRAREHDAAFIRSYQYHYGDT